MPHPPPSPHDAELERQVRRAQAGDPHAVAALFQHFFPVIEQFIARRQADDPELLTSRVLLRVLDRIDQIEGNLASLRAYLFQAARNEMANDFRLRQRRPQTSPLLSLDNEADHRVELEDEVVGSSLVDELLGKLTEAQRQVVTLRFIVGLTVNDTAAVLGRDPIAVKSLQRRALATLRGMA